MSCCSLLCYLSTHTPSLTVDVPASKYNYDTVTVSCHILHARCFHVVRISSDAAVGGLRRLDEELDVIAAQVDGSPDLLELSHLVHGLTRRVCRTLEDSQAACNRAPPEQGDGTSVGRSNTSESTSLRYIYIDDSVQSLVLAVPRCSGNPQTLEFDV